MSVTYQVQTEIRTYTVTDDLTTAYRVLTYGPVQDEITSAPVQENLTAQVSRLDLDSKTTSNGFYVVSGYPEVSFPDLATTSYSVDLNISAPGYRGQSLTVNIPQNATFPIILGALQLRRLPVRIQGRVTKSTSDRSPIAGAKIVSVDDPNAPPTEHTLALRTPLYFDHTAGISVRERQLSPTGPAKQLATDAAAGAATLALSNRTGLAANHILALGPDTQIEYAVIDSLDPDPADLTQPGNATLRNVLNHSFSAGTNVQEVTLGAIGATQTLDADANAGDGILILDGLLNVDAVEVVDPTVSKLEYHAVGAFTDSDGFYSLNGVGRVAQIFLKASATGLQDSTAGWAIDYAAPVNVVDFRLSP